MAYNKNINQTGWFYHAPAKTKDVPAHELPPTSQIPGLSDLSAQPEEPQPKKGWIKETDSKYIRLAKQGGRPDLLRFKSTKPKESEAQGYSRCEWYYLEDNAIEDAQNDTVNQEGGNFEFSLPDYMVHHTHHDDPPVSGNTVPQRVPYGQEDKKSAFQRESDPTDKTVKLQEPGYGVRSGKQKNKATKIPLQKTDQEIIVPKGKPVFTSSEESDRPIMSKILSHGYQKDWHNKKEAWDAEQAKYAQQTADEDTMTTKQNSSELHNSEKRNTNSKPVQAKQQKKIVKKNKSEADKLEKELFKLSKYKNIPAKTNTNRC